MFRFGRSREKKGALTPATSRLVEGTHWQGELQTGPEGLCVEGSLEGTILSEGQVVIAPSGIVKGTIQARDLTVMGRVEGIFKVDECLAIVGAGWVEGEVELATLVVDEGATLQGTCVHRPATRQKEPVPLVPRKDDHGVEPFAPPPSAPPRAVPDYTHAVRGFDRRRY